MTDLSSRARALIEANRSALRAPHGERARIEVALRARLGAESLPADSVPAAAIGGARWSSAWGLVVSVCVLGTIAYLVLRPAPSTQVPRADGAPVATLPLVTQPTAAVESGEPPARVAAARSALPSRPVPRPRDRLATEVALLSRATRALRAGEAAAALQLFGEHRRRFPTGKLSEERTGGTAQSLCLLGRVREGRGELIHLTAGSPEAALAEEVCGSTVAFGAQ